VEEIAVCAPRFQSRFHRGSGHRQIEEAQRGLVGLQFLAMRRFPAPLTDRCHAISHAVYLASKELPKRANRAAGLGNISTHPGCRSELSVKPPQRTPMVAILAFPAASAS
jgi:hypothetical protein